MSTRRNSLLTQKLPLVNSKIYNYCNPIVTIGMSALNIGLEINSIPRWRTVSARIRSKDLMILNQRLHIFGYVTLNELVSEFINGKFPHITEDRQIDNMNTNTQATDQDTVLHGYNNDFFEKVDLDDYVAILY